MGVSTALDTLGSQGRCEPKTSFCPSSSCKRPGCQALFMCSAWRRQSQCCDFLLCVSHQCPVAAVHPCGSCNADSRFGVTSHISTEPTVWRGKGRMCAACVRLSDILRQSLHLQLVGIFCKGLLPGLLPLVWSIAILKVRHILSIVNRAHLDMDTYVTFTVAAAWVCCHVLCSTAPLGKHAVHDCSLMH